MALRFFTDVHVPKAIVAGLRARGVDVVTAQDASAANLEDEALLQRASDDCRVLFTQDKDFLQIAADRQCRGAPFFGIVYAPQFVAHIGPYIEDLHLLAETLSEEEIVSTLVYLPL